MTTGGSSLKAVERLREAGYQPAVVLTVVDRSQGGAEAIQKAGLKLISLVSFQEIQS